MFRNIALFLTYLIANGAVFVDSTDPNLSNAFVQMTNPTDGTVIAKEGDTLTITCEGSNHKQDWKNWCMIERVNLLYTKVALIYFCTLRK